MRTLGVRRSLKRIGVTNPYELFMSVFAVLPDDRPLFESSIRNTDDNLWLEYRAPIEMYQGVRPGLKWNTPSRYIASLESLFPGVSPSTIVRHVFLRVARGTIPR